MNNREYKFKIWDINAKTFQCCYDICLLGSFAHIAIGDQCYLCNTPDKIEFIQVQYTGFKTTDDNELYEGDIVSTIYGGKGHIEFDQATAAYRIFGDDGKAYPLITVRVTEDNGINIAKLIPVYDKLLGNLFENPELLTNNNK